MHLPPVSEYVTGLFHPIKFLDSTSFALNVFHPIALYKYTNNARSLSAFDYHVLHSGYFLIIRQKKGNTIWGKIHWGNAAGEENAKYVYTTDGIKFKVSLAGKLSNFSTLL